MRRRFQICGCADQLGVAGDDERPRKALDVVLARILRAFDQLALRKPGDYLSVVHAPSLTDQMVSVNRAAPSALAIEERDDRPHAQGLVLAVPRLPLRLLQPLEEEAVDQRPNDHRRLGHGLLRPD